MGILDFDSVFDMLDPAQRGYITSEQVQEYDSALHLTAALCPAQVKAAIQQVCGEAEQRVTRKYFVLVSIKFTIF